MLQPAIYICVTQSSKSHHLVFFSSAVAAREEGNTSPAASRAPEVSWVWKTGLLLPFQRPLGTEDQGAAELMTENRPDSYESQCHFNTISRVYIRE